MSAGFSPGEEKEGEGCERDEDSDLSQDRKKDAEEGEERYGGYEERCLSHLSGWGGRTTGPVRNSSCLQVEEARKEDDDDEDGGGEQFHWNSLSGANEKNNGRRHDGRAGY